MLTTNDLSGTAGLVNRDRKRRRAFAYTTLIVFWFAVMGTAQEPASKVGKNLAKSTVPAIQPRTMPPLKGLTLEQAKALLATYGQERILPPITGPSDLPLGQIFDQNPHPGDPLTSKTEITLYISTGPPPVASPTPSADISVKETLNKRKEYWVGDQVQYRIDVHNAGPSTATNVQLTDTPTNLVNLTFDTKAGDCTDKTCTIKSLDVNSPATINVTATIESNGRFANVVRVEAFEPDPKQEDNTSPDNAAQANASVDVSASQKLDPAAGPFHPGQSVQYTLTIKNAGPTNATNIGIVDKRMNLTVTQVSDACTRFPCTIRNLAAGAAATIVVTASIDHDGPFDYAAELKLTEHDVSPDNNNIPPLGDVATAIPPPTPKFPPPWVWPILILIAGGLVGGGGYIIWRIWPVPPPPPPIPVPVPPPPPTVPQVPPTPVVRGEVEFESSSSTIEGLKMRGPQIRLHTVLEIGQSIFDRPLPIIKRKVIK